MSKLTTWNEVQEVLAGHKVPKGLKEALEAILAPKSGGGVSNPPKEIDGVMNYYCRFHETYEPETNMVMSNGKSKGYCKASISIWNKRNSAIKRKEAEISELVLAGDFEQAQMCSKELQEMKEELNAHASYDLKADWESFSKPTKEEGE